MKVPTFKHISSLTVTPAAVNDPTRVSKALFNPIGSKNNSFKILSLFYNPIKNFEIIINII